MRLIDRGICCSRRSIAPLRRSLSPQAVKKGAHWRRSFLDVPNTFIPEVDADGVARDQILQIDRRVDYPMRAFPRHRVEYRRG